MDKSILVLLLLLLLCGLTDPGCRDSSCLRESDIATCLEHTGSRSAQCDVRGFSNPLCYAIRKHNNSATMRFFVRCI